MRVMKPSALTAALLGAALLALGACATTPPYQPASASTSAGYRDFAIEENRYRVSYRAPSIEMADGYALRRAAELTRERGYDWFEVISRDTDRNLTSSSGSRISIGGATGSGGGVALGGGIGFGLGSSSSGQTLVSIEVLMGNDPAPDRGRIYRADSVLANVSASY